MIICVNGGTSRPERLEELEVILAELDAILPTMPGFISSKDYQAEDGEWVNILRFETEEDLAGWRDEGVHKSYQAVVGDYYSAFWVQTAEPHREYIWQEGKRTDGDLSWMFRE